MFRSFLLVLLDAVVVQVFVEQCRELDIAIAASSASAASMARQAMLRRQAAAAAAAAASGDDSSSSSGASGRPPLGAAAAGGMGALQVCWMRLALLHACHTVHGHVLA